jgi:hypothetical protein
MGVRGAAAVCAVVVGVLVAGCSSSGGDETAGAGSSASVSAAASSAAALSPREALAAYQEVVAPGCTDAADCQAFMTRKLAAADRVRDAMKAADATVYAEPIGYVGQADAQADHYGRDNLAGRGNMLAVGLPLQRMVAWFRSHPGA